MSSNDSLAPALNNALPLQAKREGNADGDGNGKENEPEVQFILTFEAQDAKLVKAKKQVSTSEVEDRAKEYERLIQVIRSVGLQVTARASRLTDGMLLLFVRAPSETLIAASKLENLNDYMHGVKANFEQQSTSSLSRSSSLSSNAFSSAERVRFTHDLLTRPKPHGANIRIGSPDFPHLRDMTPLHDTAYNHAWLQRWSDVKSMVQIKVTELDRIRAQFGEQIALYFGFLNFYFQFLASIAAIGVAFWAGGAPFHPVYSLLLVLWACVFVEMWRMKERKLAVRWGTTGIASVDARRSEFTPNTVRKDPATGDDEEVFEWWRRELRIALSVPVMLFFAALLGATLTTMFATEVFISKLYNGPGSKFVPLIPTGLFVVCVPQIMAAWQATAAALTSWENHYSVRTHDAAMTIKMFALQGFVAYGALTLSAFVYIPFGQAIMDNIVQRGFFASGIRQAEERGDLKRTLSGSVDFGINPNRMHAQLFAVLTTSQAINAFTEVGLPFIMRKVKDFMASQKEVKPPSSSAEAKFVHRVEKELELPPYDTFGDYAEMATQFGYIVLWSTIWPLAPVMGFINNFFELRSDALKIAVHARRPVPVRAESIGPWLEVLGFLAWFAAMLNASLIYLFQPSPEAHLAGHSAYETVLRSHLHPGGGATTPGKVVDSIVYPSDPANAARSPLSFSNLLPSYLPTSGTSGALLASLLLALASEHVYGIVRSGVRHVLERALWRGSAEEVEVRRREFQMRNEALQQSGLAAQATAALKDVSPTRVGGPHNSGFWRSADEEGLAVIRGGSKGE